MGGKGGGGVTHSELGGDRLLHLAEQLAIEVEGEDGREDLLGVLLEDHVLAGGGGGIKREMCIVS